MAKEQGLTESFAMLRDVASHARALYAHASQEAHEWKKFRDSLWNYFAPESLDARSMQFFLPGINNSGSGQQVLNENKRRKSFLIQLVASSACVLAVKCGRTGFNTAGGSQMDYTYRFRTDASGIPIGESVFSSGPAGQTIPTWHGSVWLALAAGTVADFVLVTEFF